MKNIERFRNKLDGLNNLLNEIPSAVWENDPFVWLNNASEKLDIMPSGDNDEQEARKIVGHFIKAGWNPTFSKPYKDALHLEASFKAGGWKVCIESYRPKGCRVVEYKVEVPAKPAEPAKTVTKSKLVCDEVDDVQAGSEGKEAVEA